MNIRALFAEAVAAIPPGRLADPAEAARFTEDLLSRVEGTNRPALIRRLGALARATGLDLPLPQILRPPRPPQPTRRADWARHAEQVFIAAEHLQARLADRHGTPTDFAGRALASAILFGGLFRPEAWPAFWQILRDGPRFGGSRHVEDLAWIDLRLPRTAGRAAQDADGETLRFFPDVITLSLIARAKGAQTEPGLSPQRLLGIAMQAIGIDDPDLTPEAIRSAGFAMIEDASPQPIPAILFEVARGALPAFSAAEDVWHDILGGVPAPGAGGSPARREMPPAPVRHADGAVGSLLGIEASIRRLTAAVMAQGPAARKQTRAPIAAALQELLAERPAPVAQGIALWALDLLARRRAPGTLRRYVPTLARTLAGRLGEGDPAQMPPAQIEVLVEEALDLLPRAERLYRTARIAQLFDFASADPRLAWPRIELDVEGGAAPRVRTALLSPQRIASALTEFAHAPIHQAAFLLGARGGLRLSDMEALRLGDVEPGPGGMLRIHHTLWGSLKSPSARRMVPLGALLTPEELRLWDRFLANRRAGDASPDAPLLASGGGLLPLAPFDRRRFAFALGQATGLRPHDLRHGALSNLALVLLAPDGSADIVHNLTGWRSRQCTALRQRLVAGDPWRGMNELARLAGHRDPATTIESYVHICDLALGLHIRAASHALPLVEAARCLGLNRRSLPARKKELRPEALRGKILEHLTVETIRILPPVAVPPPQPPVIGIPLILQIEDLIATGKSAPEIAEHFALPLRVVNALIACARPGRLKGLRDRQAASDLAEAVLAHSEARAWALQALKAPRRGISFAAPLAAEIWLAPCAGQLPVHTELRAPHPERWGRWARGARLLPPVQNRGDRLTLIPRSPDGVEGMSLARFTARLVLTVLAARAREQP